MLYNRARCRSALLGSALALAAFASGAQAARYKVLHKFAGAPTDGAYSHASVSFDAAGDLYGTTSGGGSSGSGTIFKVANDGSYTVLHSFDGAAGGSDPEGGVTIDKSTGNLYGTTGYGGDSDTCYSCGVIYELAADGTYTVLHSFTGFNDGHTPGGRMIRDELGNLYGTAAYGGADYNGTIFKYGTDGSFTVLHAFVGTDGSSPEGSLVSDRAGNLYGVTYQFGASDAGTVYRLAPDDILTTLYSFTGGADGGYPEGGLDRDKAGNLYGTTGNGGAGNYGTVFKLTPKGKVVTLYSFTGGPDGAYPEGDILWTDDDSLYGTTEGGGDPTCNCGVVFKLTPDGTETVLHAFAGSDGSYPGAGVTERHRKLYGATPNGGRDGNGVVFKLRLKERK